MASSAVVSLMSRPVATAAPRALLGSSKHRRSRRVVSSSLSDGAGNRNDDNGAPHSLVTSTFSLRLRRRAAVVVHDATPNCPYREWGEWGGGGSESDRSISASSNSSSSSSSSSSEEAAAAADQNREEEEEDADLYAVSSDVCSNVVSPPASVSVNAGAMVPSHRHHLSQNQQHPMEAEAEAEEVEVEVLEIMEGMPPQMIALMRGEPTSAVAAMDAADVIAADSNAKRALAQEALRASDARLAAIMSKHERLNNALKTRSISHRGASVTVHARPEYPDVGYDECSDAILAMELEEAAAEVETALCDVERSQLRQELDEAEEKIAAAESFAETLASDMGAAVAEAEAHRREASEAKERLGAVIDERTEKVGELLDEIDYWHAVATEAQDGEKQAREELETVRAELEAANTRRGVAASSSEEEEEAEKEKNGKKRQNGKKKTTRAAGKGGEEKELQLHAAMEAKDRELESLKMSLEEAKQAASAADEEMAALRRQAVDAAAVAEQAALASAAAAKEEDGAAKGKLEEAHSAANAAAEEASKAVSKAGGEVREAKMRALALESSVRNKDDELSAVKKQLEEAMEATSKSTAAAVEASYRLHKVEAEAEEAKLAAAAAALCVAKEMMTKMREQGVKF